MVGRVVPDRRVQNQTRLPSFSSSSFVLEIFGLPIEDEDENKEEYELRTGSF